MHNYHNSVINTPIKAEQEAVTGPLAFTKSWVLDHWEPQCPGFYYHIASLFEIMDVMTPSVLETIIVFLVKHHDILRLRVQGESGNWQQVITDNEEVPISWIDISPLSSEEQVKIVEKTAYDLHVTLNPFAGSLLRVTYFDRGKTLPGQLLFIIHHIITDGYSQAILYEDLETIYKQVRKDQKIFLPHKTVSFKRWSEYVIDYVQKNLQQNHDWLKYYQSLPWEKLRPLPADYSEQNKTPIVYPEREFTVTLDASQVKSLRRWLPYLKMQFLEVLLAALVRAFAKWTGVPVLYILLFDSGRLIFPEVNVSRTIGSFIQSRWCFLDLSDYSSVKDTLLATKQQMRSLPNKGLDFELALTHIEDLKFHENFLNYHIRFNFQSTGFFKKAKLDDVGHHHILRPVQGKVHAPAGIHHHKNYKLDCSSFFFQEKFYMTWRHDERAYHCSIIEQLAQYYIESLQEFAKEAERLPLGSHLQL